MVALVAVRDSPEQWFLQPPSALVVKTVAESTLLVAGRSKYRSWASGDYGEDQERIRTLLERTPAVLGSSASADFRLPDGENSASHLDILVNSDRFHDLVSHRQKSPFQEGEDTNGAFRRIFCPALTVSREWHLIDQFLLEQLLRRRGTYRLLLDNLEHLPDRIEIHSEIPVASGRREAVSLDAPESQDALRAFSEAFRAARKDLEVYAYERPKDRSLGFPHPRMQMMILDNSNIFTHLDNGLQSLTNPNRQAVAFKKGEKEEWTRAKAELSALERQRIV